jgi:hypothetical protein
MAQPPPQDINFDNYEYAPKNFDAEQLEGDVWEVKKGSKLIPGRRYFNRYGTYGRFDKNDEKEMMDKLVNRTKFSYNQELAHPRSAIMWMYDHGENPDNYDMQLIDLDNEPRTPDDVIIRRKMDNSREAGRLFAAGGYRMRNYTPKDVRSERLRETYLYAMPDKKTRPKDKIFKKYRKSMIKEDTIAPSSRIYSELNTQFKMWLAVISQNYKGLEVKCGVNGQKLTAPGYFALLQLIHSTFKHCVIMPIVLRALSGEIPMKEI